MYIKAILIDIKSLFNRINQLAKSEDRGAELLIFEFCKDAIDLHARAYGYFTINFLFQTRASPF